MHHCLEEVHGIGVAADSLQYEVEIGTMRTLIEFKVLEAVPESGGRSLQDFAKETNVEDGCLGVLARTNVHSLA